MIHSDLPEGIEKLKQIEKINGRLTVTDNTGVRDLSFLRNLKEINNTDESSELFLVFYLILHFLQERLKVYAGIIIKLCHLNLLAQYKHL